MSLAAIQPITPDFYERLGPISALIADSNVTEIMVMGARDIYVEVNGKILLTGARFDDDDQLLDVIRFIVESVGRRIDEENPLCDARLPSGARVHAAIPPVAVDGPLLTIRKFASDLLQASDLVALGSCSPAGLAFLQACVMGRANILISGGASTGKTTLLNILSGYVSDDERIVTIEDAAELQLRQRHVARLEARPPGAERGKEVNIRDLVMTSLRMRPDRIVVGEVRGPEALDMLQAMNTGHYGSMTTIHANKPRDALSRVETLVMMAGFDLPSRAIRAQIASGINIVAHLERVRDGSRKLTRISEVTGMEDDVIAMQDIFVFRPEGTDAYGRVVGAFVLSGIRPRILERLEDMGLRLPEELSRLFPGAA
ncbi:MAG TPA: CpaF family protein [Candidatus Limnocylindria bacterium]|jgi:pilus assembly protein CpaF|nr:CpaF family protein [Candidatus Limnocylindria bacterium]